MTGNVRASLLSLTILAVIVFSAFGTTTVYADGGTTKDPPPTETTSSTEEGTNETTSAPAEVTAEATDPAAAVVEASSTPDAAAAEATASPATTEEVAPVVEESAPAADATILTAVPDNTTVAVLDASGKEQPLATQAAADAVATSDPMWCPAGAVATPGAGGCTPSFSSFTELLSELQARPDLYAGAGTIYVQQGAYTGSDPNNVIDFNAYNLSAINGPNLDLSVSGGWDPATGMTNSTTPSTLSNTRLLIGSAATPWGGALTLSNITIDYTNPGPNVPAIPESALALYSQTNITLLNVNVTDAPDTGADLNAIGGNVAVIGSTFDRNQTTGARIRAGGAVTVVNSSFSNPPNGRRQDTGLDIQNAGNVTLVGVLANQNRVAGTNINTTGTFIDPNDPTTLTGAVSISGSSFSDTKVIQGTTFDGHGLLVVTPRNIALINVIANNNFMWGAKLQAGGDIDIFTSEFNANTTASPGFIDDTGLFITAGGHVDLEQVTANDNRLYGAQIDAVGPVSVNGGSYSNNRGIINTGGVNEFHGHGLQITSQSSISLNNVTATNNMLFGAQLNSTAGDVSVSSSTFSNTSTGSASNALGEGLEIVTPGNVFLANVVLDNNQVVGADIQAANVTLTTVTATNNGTDGVLIQALCTGVDGGTFSGNGQHGINLGTSGLDLLNPPTAGDIFPATPPTCSLLLSSGNTANAGTTTSAASLGGSNVFVSLETSSLQGSNGASVPVTGSAAQSSTEVAASSLTLKSVLGGHHPSFFSGKYAYVYSSSGMQIVAFSSKNEVAMGKSFRAY